MLTIKIGPDGRILVPVEVRRRLGLEPGESLIVSTDDGRLVLESRNVALRRLQRRFAAVPRTTSLADELIEDRRREAMRENR